MAIKKSFPRCKKAKASNHLFSVLPPEIIEWEILTRLPVRSLLQFKSVCSSWNSLISSNNDFIKSHLDLNPNKDSLILKQTHYNSHYNSVFSRYLTLIGCIDGLVCVSSRPYNFSCVIEIAIWNPAINRCLDIPPPASRGNLLLGFGFDSVANDFKVMCGSLIEKQPLAVDVYSCKGARWKKTAPSNILYSGCINNQMEPIIVNGSPFWLDTENQDTEISLVVISFDVHHEVFSLLPSFCVGYSESRRSDLMNFRDSLAIMVHDRCTYFVEPIDVYIFNQRCSDWNKISIGPFICKEPNIELNKIYVGTAIEAETTIKLYELIPCSRDGDILFVNCHSCRLYGVNPETHTIKILKEVSSEEHIYNCFNYSESLSFIEGMKPVNEKRDEGRFKFLLGEELELARSYEYI